MVSVLTWYSIMLSSYKNKTCPTVNESVGVESATPDWEVVGTGGSHPNGVEVLHLYITVLLD